MDLLTASVLYRESSGTPYTLVVLPGELDATNSQQLRNLLESGSDHVRDDLALLVLCWQPGTGDQSV